MVERGTKDLHASGGDQAVAQLPEDVGMFLDKLRRDYPAIDQAWLLGSRKSSTGSVIWDLLLFGDRNSLEAVRRDAGLSRADVNLFIVTDGDRFESVWGDSDPGRLSESGWRLDGPSSARFAAPLASAEASAHATASRVR